MGRATVWRLLDALDTGQLAAIARARAVAREVVWAQRAEATGAAFGPARAAGRDLPGLAIDLDATIVVCHSEKQAAAPTFKGTFGYHPMLAYLDNTGEALAGLLRPGNAGANTAADHVAVLDAALTQIPDEHRHGTPILIRTDTAGCSKAFLAHIRGLRIPVGDVLGPSATRDGHVVEIHTAFGQQLLDVPVGQPEPWYHRTANTITSGGNRNSANAERGGRTGRVRRAGAFG